MDNGYMNELEDSILEGMRKSQDHLTFVRALGRSDLAPLIRRHKPHIGTKVTFGSRGIDCISKAKARTLRRAIDKLAMVKGNGSAWEKSGSDAWGEDAKSTSNTVRKTATINGHEFTIEVMSQGLFRGCKITKRHSAASTYHTVSCATQ